MSDTVNSFGHPKYDVNHIRLKLDNDLTWVSISMNETATTTNVINNSSK